jgi:arginine-tRNA-protein transferase
LPDRDASLTYEIVGAMTADEYQSRLLAGWRRFGFALFTPVCATCSKCLSMRIPVDTFEPDRSQRRAMAANASDVRIVIGKPSVTDEKLDLYDRFHASQHVRVGWAEHSPKNAEDYCESFVDNPIPTQEWCYYLGDKLIGVGYVDRLAVGLSAIYFFHDPDERHRSLGTYNVLSIIRAAREWNLPHVYLGYFVAGCRSLEYKARFRPSEILAEDQTWQPYGG